MQDVADMLYADEDSVDTWSESPLTANVHLCEYEAERVLQLCLQPEACTSYADGARLESSSTCLALSTLSPGDLPASTALSCCTQPAEGADTDVLDTFRCAPAACWLIWYCSVCSSTEQGSLASVGIHPPLTSS